MVNAKGGINQFSFPLPMISQLTEVRWICLGQVIYTSSWHSHHYISIEEPLPDTTLVAHLRPFPYKVHL